MCTHTGSARSCLTMTINMCMHICVPLCAGTSRRSTAARPGTAGCEAGMAQCIQDGRRPQPSFFTTTGFDKHVEFKHALPSKMAAMHDSISFRRCRRHWAHVSWWQVQQVAMSSASRLPPLLSASLVGACLTGFLQVTTIPI